MNKKFQTIVAVLLIAVLTVLSAGCGSKTAGTGASNEAGTKGSISSNPLPNKRIALVMQMNLGTFSAQYISGVKEEAEKKFGGQVTVFAADGDLAHMAANLDAAVNQKFDAILIDHGTPEALTKGVQNAVAKNIPVVVFDANVKVPGVTVLEQGDKDMANSVLEKLAKDSGGKGNIVKIWVAGFAPMERRQVAYQDFLKKNPGIKEVAAFGAATANTALDTQAQMEAILKKYPNKGDITAV